MSTEENKALVLRFQEELWQGNVALIDEVMAPDISIGGPGGWGREQFKAYVLDTLQRMPDLAHKIEEMIAEDDKVMFRFTVQAKGGQLLGGLGLIGVGTLATGLVIAGGSSDGLQGVPFFQWSTLWELCKLALAALCAAGVWWAMQFDASQALARRTLLGASAALVAIK